MKLLPFLLLSTRILAFAKIGFSSDDSTIDISSRTNSIQPVPRGDESLDDINQLPKAKNFEPLAQAAQGACLSLEYGFYVVTVEWDPKPQGVIPCDASEDFRRLAELQERVGHRAVFIGQVMRIPDEKGPFVKFAFVRASHLCVIATGDDFKKSFQEIQIAPRHYNWDDIEWNRAAIVWLEKTTKKAWDEIEENADKYLQQEDHCDFHPKTNNCVTFATHLFDKAKETRSKRKRAGQRNGFQSLPSKDNGRTY